MFVSLADAQAPAQPGAASNPPAQGRKKRVAVFDFDYATVQSYSATSTWDAASPI
jgi:type IV secretory pathway VirB9-like protein